MTLLMAFDNVAKHCKLDLLFAYVLSNTNQWVFSTSNTSLNKQIPLYTWKTKDCV